MKVLDLKDCEQVVRKFNSGVNPKRIAAKFGITHDHVKLIQKCYREKFPLDDYLKVESGEYIRIEQRLLRLPMSQWAEAL
jgi:hypothetical protein